MNSQPFFPAEPAASFAGKYLTVVLAREAYALPVLKVREIIRLTKITPVAQMPVYVRGVMNLRGRVIPVVDLRLKFGLPAEMAERTCIVVVHVLLSSRREIPMGLVVDAVDEVVTLGDDQIEPPPQLGAQVDTRYLTGLAKVNSQVKLLLDVDRAVAAESVAPLARAG